MNRGRKYSTKVNISLVSKLRKATECSMIKAKEALLKHNNEYQLALEEISNQTVNMEKLNSRVSKEGLIGVKYHQLGYSSSLVEVNCETDFVSKNELFQDFVSNLAETTSLKHGSNSNMIHRLDMDLFNESKMINSDHSIEQNLIKAIGKLKEKIQIRKAFCFSNIDPLYVTAAYSHSSFAVAQGLGRLGSIVVLKTSKKLDSIQREEVTVFAKKIAQHVSGFNPTSVDVKDGVDNELVLMKQSFLFGGGSVENALEKFGTEKGFSISIVDFKRVECGEGIEKKVENFANEVMAQMK